MYVLFCVCVFRCVCVFVSVHWCVVLCGYVFVSVWFGVVNVLFMCLRVRVFLCGRVFLLCVWSVCIFVCDLLH